MQTTDLDEFAKKLMPLTVFRRKAGEVIAKLEEVGELLITRDGKPVAKLSSISKSEKNDGKAELKADLEKIRKFAGGFHFGKITPKRLKKITMQQYDRVLSG